MLRWYRLVYFLSFWTVALSKSVHLETSFNDISFNGFLSSSFYVRTIPNFVFIFRAYFTTYKCRFFLATNYFNIVPNTPALLQPLNDCNSALLPFRLIEILHWSNSETPDHVTHSFSYHITHSFNYNITFSRM